MALLKVSMEKELIFQLLLPINLWCSDMDLEGTLMAIKTQVPFFPTSDGPLVTLFLRDRKKDQPNYCGLKALQP